LHLVGYIKYTIGHVMAQGLAYFLLAQSPGSNGGQTTWDLWCTKLHLDTL